MLFREQLKSAGALRDWAAGNGVAPRDLERIYAALEAGQPALVNAGQLQNPTILVPGLTAAPWHDPACFSWAALLESNYDEIRAEFLRQYSADGMAVHPETAELAVAGRWSVYRFYHMGKPYERHLSDCPVVARVLAQVPGADAAGMCYFSVMAPGTKVKPHNGFLNTRIRCHLGLVVPAGAWMRVGTEKRGWEEGSCVIFDDSFEHEVENESDHSRAVLLLDSWHPDLSAAERRAMAFLIQLWREHVD